MLVGAAAAMLDHDGPALHEIRLNVVMFSASDDQPRPARVGAIEQSSQEPFTKVGNLGAIAKFDVDVDVSAGIVEAQPLGVIERDPKSRVIRSSSVVAKDTDCQEVATTVPRASGTDSTLRKQWSSSLSNPYLRCSSATNSSTSLGAGCLTSSHIATSRRAACSGEVIRSTGMTAKS